MICRLIIVYLGKYSIQIGIKIYCDENNYKDCPQIFRLLGIFHNYLEHRHLNFVHCYWNRAREKLLASL